MEQLRPCPFCGGEAVMVENKSPRLYRPARNHSYGVCCPSCDMIFGYDVDYGGEFDTKEEEIEAWKRRTE